MNTFVQITEMISAVFKSNSKNNTVLFVVNTDNGYGLYVKKLVRLANKLGLTVKSKAALKHIKMGDVIVFGDSHLFDGKAYDYRVARDLNELVSQGAYDGHEALAFDLVSELDEVMEAVEDLYPQRTAKKQKREKTNTAFLHLGSVVGQPARVRYCEPEPEIVILDMRPEDQDVEINDTFVKIGYRTFDIYIESGTGREYVRVDGVKRYIMVDRFGQKYLK